MNPLSETQLTKISSQLKSLPLLQFEEKVAHMLKEPKVNSCCFTI
jgi:hypothetical protein